MKQHGVNVKEELPRRRLANGALIVKKHARHILCTLSLLALFFLLLAITAVVCKNAFYPNEAILGLKLNNHIVGELSQKDLQMKINNLLDARENTTIPIKVAGTDIHSTITLRQLGERADRQKVYLQAISAGRTGSILEQIGGQQIAALGGWNIDLNHPNFDVQRAKKYIESLAHKTNIPARSAYFVFENEKVFIRPDSRGRVIDVSTSVENILNARPENGSLVTLPVVHPLPPVNTETLQLLLPVARSLSDQALTIKAGTHTVEISRSQIAQALVVSSPLPSPLDQKRTLPHISFNRTKLTPIVDSLIKNASIEPTPTLMSGGNVIRPGTPGLAPKDKQPIDKVIEALQARPSLAIKMVELPMEPVAPPIVENANSDLLARTGTGPVYLTFDDGPGAYTEQILDILKRYNVHATFYVVGRNVPSKASTMQRMRNEGHVIGNHSYNHADLSKLSRAQVLQELSATQAAVQQACGVIPTAFRPPYGALNPTVREVAASLGLSVDMWTVDTDDWQQPGANEIVRRILGRDQAGSVVLLHILHAQTVDALPAIIEGIRSQGYTLS